MRTKTLFNKRGSASVIVIMVMLLLVIFGVLAFVSAGSSLRLAQKNAGTIQDYYLLDKQGEIAVGQISALIKAGPVSQETVGQIQQATGITAVTAIPEPQGEYTFTLQLQDPAVESGASLRIRLQTVSGRASGTALEIQEWKLVYKPFVYNDTVNLWDGGN